MKRLLKRIAAFVLVLSLAAGFCAVPDITVHASSGDFVIDRDGVLTGYKGVGGEVAVPDGVVSIGEKAFAGCNSIVTVKLPSSVRSIGKSAFDSCNELTGITLSGNLKSIGENAFWGCKSLKNLRIPDSVTEIGFGAFCNCDSLNGIRLSKDVKKIGTYAFGFRFSGGYDRVNDFVIMGEKKSTASDYADKYEIPFITKDSLQTALTGVGKKSGKLTVKWKKNTKVSGYEIQYSTGSSFSGSGTRTITVRSGSKSTQTVKGIKSKTKYYVRIRGYRTIAGKKYYSAWSKAKKI